MSEYYYGPPFIRESRMVIENGELTLKSGQQWKSESFKASKGSIAILDVSTDQRVYYTISSLKHYNSIF